MIERIQAENGSTVLRQDGRLLASAVDPESEGRAWLARRRLLLGDVHTAFVLGAGAGYHIAELSRAYPHLNVIVVEPNQEIVSACRHIQGLAGPQVRFESAPDAKALRASPVVRAAVQKSFVVLQHPPSVRSSPEYYRGCERNLVAREWGALNWQWQLRGYPALESPPRIHGGPQALTLLDLNGTELIQNSELRERMIVKALRELLR